MKKFTSIAQAKKETGLSYLGGVNISQKIVKSQKVNNIMTYCIYLAPANVSGYNVCSHATKECKIGCLATSGRVKMESENNTKITDARIKKTKLFFENREYFMEWLFAEISNYQRKASNLNMGFIVRLNGTSDIDWVNVIYNDKNIFEIFPEIRFYDYTKNFNKLNNIPENYYLTLSYTGYNWNLCKDYLNKGGNVAMVFNIPVNQKLPVKFNGFDVIDGDITDARMIDKKGSIAGLHWKNIANKENNEYVKNSVFCIQPDNNNCVY